MSICQKIGLYHATMLKILYVFHGNPMRELHKREEADYGLVFSEEGAISVVNNTEKFLNKVKKPLHI